MTCHRDLLGALREIACHKKLATVYVLSEERIHAALGQSMHALHSYFRAYLPEDPAAAWPEFAEGSTEYGLLLAACLGFTLKVSTGDYVLEYLPIREQLALFGIMLPAEPLSCGPSTSASACDSLLQAGAFADGLLAPALAGSEADLNYARLQLEERLKFALGYNFAYESPLGYVRRFFEAAFAPEQRRAPLVRKWQEETETFVVNTFIFPLSQEIHPVYLAAAYLNTMKSDLQRQAAAAEKPDSSGGLPDAIGGHSWFKYVDPAVEEA